MTRRTLTTLLVIVCLASGAVGAQITWDRLANANTEPHNWLMYSGANNGWRQELRRAQRTLRLVRSTMWV